MIAIYTPWHPSHTFTEEQKKRNDIHCRMAILETVGSPYRLHCNSTDHAKRKKKY